MPEIDKKINAISSLTPSIKSESEKIDQTGKNTVLGKVLSFVEGGGNVKAQAAGFGCFQINPWVNWSRGLGC